MSDRKHPMSDLRQRACAVQHDLRLDLNPLTARAWSVIDELLIRLAELEPAPGLTVGRDAVCETPGEETPETVRLKVKTASVDGDGVGRVSLVGEPAAVALLAGAWDRDVEVVVPHE